MMHKEGMGVPAPHDEKQERAADVDVGYRHGLRRQAAGG